MPGASTYVTRVITRLYQYFFYAFPITIFYVFSCLIFWSFSQAHCFFVFSSHFCTLKFTIICNQVPFDYTTSPSGPMFNFLVQDVERRSERHNELQTEHRERKRAQVKGGKLLMLRMTTQRIVKSQCTHTYKYFYIYTYGK